MHVAGVEVRLEPVLYFRNSAVARGGNEQVVDVDDNDDDSAMYLTDVTRLRVLEGAKSKGLKGLAQLPIPDARRLHKAIEGLEKPADVIGICCVLEAAGEKDVKLFAKVAVEIGVRDIEVMEAAINYYGVR